MTAMTATINNYSVLSSQFDRIGNDLIMIHICSWFLRHFFVYFLILLDFWYGQVNYSSFPCQLSFAIEHLSLIPSCYGSVDNAIFRSSLETDLVVVWSYRGVLASWLETF